jgi:hypothetical protein
MRALGDAYLRLSERLDDLLFTATSLTDLGHIPKRLIGPRKLVFADLEPVADVVAQGAGEQAGEDETVARGERGGAHGCGAATRRRIEGQQGSFAVPKAELGERGMVDRRQSPSVALQGEPEQMADQQADQRGVDDHQHPRLAIAPGDLVQAVEGAA